MNLVYCAELKMGLFKVGTTASVSECQKMKLRLYSAASGNKRMPSGRESGASPIKVKHGAIMKHIS